MSDLVALHVSVGVVANNNDRNGQLEGGRGRQFLVFKHKRAVARHTHHWPRGEGEAQTDGGREAETDRAHFPRMIRVRGSDETPYELGCPARADDDLILA